MILSLLAFAALLQPLRAEEGMWLPSLIAQRKRRIPLQWLTGRQSFMGHDFRVTPDVLIPRFDSETMVSEAIRLAKSLHMRTVAEGVEIKEQVDFLADLGCDMIQGYYFAKPMPKNEYESRMGQGII